MEKKLVWENLLCEDRVRSSSDSSNERNGFEADYDRIVGSSSVRRLQDKAQVFPLQENDFTRTRLTHSLTVSSIARSMGKKIGLYLEKKTEENFGRKQTEQLQALLQTVGLVHDLGNPPFGHYGEAVIGNWFSKWFLEDGSAYASSLTDQQIEEFKHYDGNVQNLRIVSKLQTMNDRYGANFTYGTMACLIKYPWNVLDSSASKGKYGYFESEADLIRNIYSKTGICDHVRHPATFIMEAADDITYIGDDIEDGAKKGYIPWEQAYRELRKKFSLTHSELFKSCDEYEQKIKSDLEPADKLAAKVRYFRNVVQGYLIQLAVDTFKKDYGNIMTGKRPAKQDLLSSDEAFVEALKGITREYCFSCREVLALEVVGHHVISGLLDTFVPALVSADADFSSPKSYAGKLYYLISSNFKYIAKQDYSEDDSSIKSIKKVEDFTLHDKLRLIVDFISGMTDSYAMGLYQELTGIKLHYH